MVSVLIVPSGHVCSVREQGLMRGGGVLVRKPIASQVSHAWTVGSSFPGFRDTSHFSY